MEECDYKGLRVTYEIKMGYIGDPTIPNGTSLEQEVIINDIQTYSEESIIDCFSDEALKDVATSIIFTAQ